ncbi:g3695 [Coccomyxa elongata]
MAPTSDETVVPLLSGHAHPTWNLRTTFSAPLTIITAAILGVFITYVKYPELESTDAHVNQYYMYYIHVAIMIFIGFGYLMTFLRRYSYSAVGLNYLTSAVVMLEAIVLVGLVQQVIFGNMSYIELNLPLLIDSAFAAGAAMISFGAVLGKVSPAQITFLLILQVPIYAFNAHLATEVFGALDVGGSITIHAFGAYYGLASALVLAPVAAGAGHPKNGACYVSDMTAMIGTIFLFIFWPSFNGALASGVPGTISPGPFQQFNCIINTVVSLLGATVATFIASAFVGGKFDMVHIQNATLAGGVAIGSAANLMVGPGGALGVGILAGLISTLGYAYLTPVLEAKIGLRDTCGVHNLHGMPGILGGLVAAATAYLAPDANAPVMKFDGSKQALHQLAALGSTLGIAIVGGLVMGLLVAKLDIAVAGQELSHEHLFEDSVYWHEVEPEAPEGEHPAVNGTAAEE